MKIFKRGIFLVVIFLSSYACADSDFNFKDFPVSSTMKGANFAGDYYLSTYECGEGLICAQVKNLKTEKIIPFPNTYLSGDSDKDCITSDTFSIDYNVNSSLVVISAELQDPDLYDRGRGYTVRYYNFKNDNFKLLMQYEP